MTAPQIIEHNGERAFAVVPYRDYMRLKKAYEDRRDLAILDRAKAHPLSRRRRPFREFAKEAGWVD